MSTIYWRSNEESVEGDRPQKAPVLESRETVYASNSRADPVQGMSFREVFLTKILSFFIQPNAASKADKLAPSASSIISVISAAIVSFLFQCRFLRKNSFEISERRQRQTIYKGSKISQNKANNFVSTSSLSIDKQTVGTR